MKIKKVCLIVFLKCIDNFIFRLESSKIPMVIGISIGSILLLLVLAIVVATLIFIKRRKTNLDKKDSTSSM